jgi:hypothetical protein
MLFRYLPVVLISIFALNGSVRADSVDPVFDQIDAIVKTLSGITGLSERHPVPYGRMSKEQLRHFLNKRIKKTIKPAEIHADELALKMFGLVPPDFDLRKSTVDLMTEQAAAFYDYDAKRLFLLEGSSVQEQTVTLAHELAHALADQYFHLDKFMESASSNDDENLARIAVAEGQASWLMIAYELGKSGRSPIPTPEMIKAFDESDASSLSDYPVLKSSPLYIRQSLLFPYSQGTLFFDAVYRRMGRAAFSYVFTNPPSDTAQVIHPDRYFAHITAAEPELPQISLTAERKEITDGDLGEFDHRVLLEQYLGAPEANNLSPHLRGAEFEITTAGKPRQPVLEYVSEWDSPSSGAAFFEAYKRVLRKKWRHCIGSVSDASTFAGSGDDGLFVTRLTGNTVWSVEGLQDTNDWTRLQRPPKAINALGMVSPQALASWRSLH